MFKAADIWDCDDTGIKTIKKTRNVLRMKGTKIIWMCYFC